MTKVLYSTSCATRAPMMPPFYTLWGPAGPPPGGSIHILLILTASSWTLSMGVLRSLSNNVVQHRTISGLFWEPSYILIIKTFVFVIFSVSVICILTSRRSNITESEKVWSIRLSSSGDFMFPVVVTWHRDGQRKMSGGCTLMSAEHTTWICMNSMQRRKSLTNRCGLDSV